ncbi:MAG: hypothetical protein WAM53_01035, partial [Terrimicrobiaceae bacterium]
MHYISDSDAANRPQTRINKGSVLFVILQTVEDGCAPGKPEATRVKVPPVELDGSRPKEMSGMRPR